MFVYEGDLEAILMVFTLEEILEMSNLQEVEVLQHLVEHGLIDLPPFLKKVEEYNEL